MPHNNQIGDKSTLELNIYQTIEQLIYQTICVESVLSKGFLPLYWLPQ